MIPLECLGSFWYRRVRRSLPRGRGAARTAGSQVGFTSIENAGRELDTVYFWIKTDEST